MTMLNRLRPNRRGGSPDNEGEIFLIVGLGNPGRRYERTRHNAGFMVAERLYDILPSGTARSRFQAELIETRDGDKRVILAKPQTFMNDSGTAVSQIARWYKVPRDRLLLVYDELDLPFGSIRLRANGSAGGHNGVSSVIKHLNTQDFARLRIGIGRPRAGSTVPYVLAPFSSDEQKALPEIIDRAADAALMWLREGVIVAMNEHNRRDRPTTSDAIEGGTENSSAPSNGNDSGQSRNTPEADVIQQADRSQ
jgi:PTH1 family peptidyl-tRNA hydrolase